MRNSPAFSAVIAIDIEEETIILELNKFILAKNNQISILSSFQAREAGAIVNNIAKRYNGKKNLERDRYVIPIRVDDGFTNILTQEPTMDERLNCKRVISTQD